MAKVKKSRNVRSKVVRKVRTPAPRSARGEAITLRGLFRRLAARKQGVTLRQFKSVAQRYGFRLESISVAASDSTLRSHIARGAGPVSQTGKGVMRVAAAAA